jgi:hypothetical protein
MEIKFYEKKGVNSLLLAIIIFICFVFAAGSLKKEEVGFLIMIGILVVAIGYALGNKDNSSPQNTGEIALMVDKKGISGNLLENVPIEWKDVYGVESFDVLKGESSFKYITLHINPILWAETPAFKTKWIEAERAITDKKQVIVNTDKLDISNRDLADLIQSVLENEQKIDKTIAAFLELNPKYKEKIDTWKRAKDSDVV